MNIQQQKPNRTCTNTYANYISFKPYIREDFNKRCGYCDDSDLFHGGARGYQIDHFKPHSIERFSTLKEEYSNLVYSCPFCNRAKSNKWENKEGFIDPCCDEYDYHISRNDKGQIQYDTIPQGKYIYENLNLYLPRHELLWMIEKLQNQSHQINNEINRLGEGHEKEVIILKEFRKIQNEINKYTNLFYDEI
jgi:hypothetical protein